MARLRTPSDKGKNYCYKKHDPSMKNPNKQTKLKKTLKKISEQNTKIWQGGGR
jgi:hypothetical protein